ncbi:20012_t:CDS:1, partial [Dentiscutata erythropus]
ILLQLDLYAWGHCLVETVNGSQAFFEFQESVSLRFPHKMDCS